VAKLNLRLIQALNSLRVKPAIAKNSKYLLIVSILKEVSKNQRKNRTKFTLNTHLQNREIFYR
jgi:hypothetical protein